ncbi:hypothetical protein Pmani_023322 [Petrolisthes manimaculis]|uniref:Uncharacterized protein n=1 Tax=Petrolisthes manimaculis TaxID=1843537 RepID=A0AAE1U180_9EUCA|nr:hypothetical protein Pmani_023322 [Petrolisthes manimaculis]
MCTVPSQHITSQQPRGSDNMIEDELSGLVGERDYPPDSSSSSETESVDNKAVDNKAVDNKAVDNKAVDNKAVDNKAVDKKAVDKKAVDKKAVDKKAVDKKAVDKKAVDKKAVDKKAVDKKAVDKKAVDKKAVDKKAVDKKAVDKKAVDKKAVDKKAVDKKAVDNEGVLYTRSSSPLPMPGWYEPGMDLLEVGGGWEWCTNTESSNTHLPVCVSEAAPGVEAAPCLTWMLVWDGAERGRDNNYSTVFTNLCH